MEQEESGVDGMRVLLQKELENEIAARLNYYNETYGIYMSRCCHSEAIQFQSMPLDFEKSTLFIVGHNGWIEYLLDKEIKYIQEKIIVLVTCQCNYQFEKYSKFGKTIYIAKQREGYAVIYSGKDYGFQFDPVESEIISYRMRKKFQFRENIEHSYLRLTD